MPAWCIRLHFLLSVSSFYILFGQKYRWFPCAVRSCLHILFPQYSGIRNGSLHNGNRWTCPWHCRNIPYPSGWFPPFGWGVRWPRSNNKIQKCLRCIHIPILHGFQGHTHILFPCLWNLWCGFVWIHKTPFPWDVVCPLRNSNVVRLLVFRPRRFPKRLSKVVSRKRMYKGKEPGCSNCIFLLFSRFRSSGHIHSFPPPRNCLPLPWGGILQSRCVGKNTL